jgi:hypothetical protein
MADYLTEIATAPLDVIYAITSTPPADMWLLPRERWALRLLKRFPNRWRNCEGRSEA